MEKFLSYPPLYVGNIEPILKQHYQRLSESEQILIRWLANQEQPVEISQNPPKLLSDSDFFKAIQSLKNRYLLQKSSALTLDLVMQHYVRNLSL